MNDSAGTPWTLTMPAGSLVERNIVFTVRGTGAPYPLTGHTWKYVTRVSATDTGTPLIDITTTVGTQGLIAVTATATLSQVALALYPAATAALTPGQYWHALWMDPGVAGAAYTWLSGNLIIAGNPQP